MPKHPQQAERHIGRSRIVSSVGLYWSHSILAVSVCSYAGLVFHIVRQCMNQGTLPLTRLL